jgi:hypothetical protein
MQSPITVERTFVLSDLTPVKLCSTEEGNYTKEIAYRIDGSNSEQILFGLKIFRDIATRLRYDAEDRFNNFPRCLIDGAQESWSSIYDAYPDGTDITEELFEETMTLWLSYFFTPEQRRALIAYITTPSLASQKPDTMTAIAFWNRLFILHVYAGMMSGNAPLLDMPHLRVAFVGHMPEQWGINYMIHRGDPVDVTTAQHASFISYFDLQARAVPPPNDNDQLERRNGNNRRGRNNGGRDQDRDNGQRNNDPRNRNNGRESDYRNRNRNYDRYRSDRTPILTNDDMCPLPYHETHTWGACRQNPNNPNYAPTAARHNNQQGRGFQGRGFQGRGNQNGGRGNQNGGHGSNGSNNDSHHQDTTNATGTRNNGAHFHDPRTNHYDNDGYLIENPDTRDIQAAFRARGYRGWAGLQDRPP